MNWTEIAAIATIIAALATIVGVVVTENRKLLVGRVVVGGAIVVIGAALVVGRNATHNDGTTNVTSTFTPPRNTTSERPPARATVMLSALPPPSGDQVVKGLAHINGIPFSNSVWLPFAQSCCGSTQTTSYVEPSGYKDFKASIGQESTGFDPGHAYAMEFQVAVNGVRQVDQQMNFGDPAQLIDVPLSGATKLQLTVVTHCPNFTCVGNAVFGDATFVAL